MTAMRRASRRSALASRNRIVRETSAWTSQIELAFRCTYFRQVDVDVPERIRLALTTEGWLLEAGQATNAVALEKPVQRGAREMRNRRLERVEAIIER